jgi:hypothetical protein
MFTDLSKVCEPLNEILEMKGIVVEALFNELHEASTIL